ncbi:hypothetical protein BDU57DRAFT_521424 [Ampelomyces quisqualis]|uniref:Uncharacterized protein n=1 Tax=Ampelomyces quisqualis TaxID=50730 RepID=A0A6A5QBX7_AMPQU|nr:hypothetical protein BDU57DRAFT_521424 [Ampelomyces quisqualis]
MDANMDDVGCSNSNITPIPDLDERGDGSVASSTDWGTPPPVDKPDANKAAAKSDDEEEDAVLGHRRRRMGTTRVRKPAVQEATDSSDAVTSPSGDDDDDLYDPGLQVDSDGHPHPPSSSPGLFVAEDEADLVLVGDTTLNRPINLTRPSITMDGLKRARAMKAEIKNNIALLQSPGKATSSRHVEDDPENQLIKKLRQEQSMSWGDIANHLNQERRDRGEPATFTESACYSRFVRTTPRVAVAVSEIGFDTKDYMHLRQPDRYVTAEGRGTGTISKAGKKRVKNFDDAKELADNIRKVVKSDNYEELETADKTEQLMEAVAKVERNFWVLVADEMERATTKLYPPNALASRYHAI